MTKPPSDPATWSSGCEAAFQSGRAVHDPTSSDRARVFRGLAEKIATEPGLQPSAAQRSSQELAGGVAKTVPPAPVLKLLKVALGTAGVTLSALGLMHVLATRPAAPPVEAPAPLATRDVIRQPATPHELTATLEASPVASDEALPAASTRHLAAPRRERPMTKTKTSLATRTRVEPARNDTRSSTTVQQPSSPKVAANTAMTAPARVSQAADPKTPQQPSAAPIPAQAKQSAAVQSVPSQSVTDESAEVAFVARINRAVMESKLTAALALCDEHGRRWPQGKFGIEREALRAIASCGSNANGAAMRAHKFLAAYASTPLAPNVREACAAQLTAAQ